MSLYQGMEDVRVKLFQPCDICIYKHHTHFQALFHTIYSFGVKMTLELVALVCFLEAHSIFWLSAAIFGLRYLSRITLGWKGYIALLQNPDTVLLIVILLDQAWANSKENWNLVATQPGLSNEYWQYLSNQCVFNEPKQLVWSVWESAVVVVGNKTSSCLLLQLLLNWQILMYNEMNDYPINKESDLSETVFTRKYLKNQSENSSWFIHPFCDMPYRVYFWIW